MVTSRMIQIAIAIAMLCGATVAVAGPPVIPQLERRFDHARHETSAKASGSGARSSPVCADCHKMDAKGVRVTAGGEHPRCTKCHGIVKTCALVKADAGTPKNPARLCDTCHLPTGQCVLPPLPAKPTGPTFASRFAHAEHIAFKVSIERDCANCHPQNAPASAVSGPSGHASCWRCHAGPSGVSTKLQSSNCLGCHQAPKAKSGASGDPFRLAKFDHKKHHTESKQASCTGCHDAKKMATNDPNAVPRPSMSTCLGACHDGQKSFSAVGTTCTKCHKSAGGITGPAFPKEMAFSHEKHSKRNVKIEACASCHSVKEDGNVEAPNQGKNHQPCAASGCHQTEFMSKSVKICGVCHDKAVPWEKALARMHDPSPEKEFFENINHKTHLQKKGTSNAACNDCHGDKLGGGKAPKGHAPCVECHGKGPPAHPMTDCGKCHSRDATKRPAESEWSVAQTFVHTRHANDSRSRKTTNCAECHAQISASTSLAQMAKPKMEVCAGCHDGKVSFKTTGFDCSKCHTKAKQPSTPTAGAASIGPGDQASVFDPRSTSQLTLVELQDRR